MIKTSIEKLAEGIGFDIGNSDDVTQANLLNGFCRGIHDSIPDNHKREIQICYLVEKLTIKSQKILHEIIDFINLKEKDNS